MNQFQAIFIPEEVYKLSKNKDFGEKIKELIHQLSYFETKGIDINEISSNEDVVINIADKILSLAYQTKAPIFIENYLVNKLGISYKNEDLENKISYKFKKSENYSSKKVYKNLHIIEPRLSNWDEYINFNFQLEKQSKGFNESFLFSYVPSYLGNCYPQLFDFKPELKSFFLNNLADLKEELSSLSEKQKSQISKPINFSISSPHPTEKLKLIVEIDGPEHENLSQKTIDDKRDSLFEKVLDIKNIRISEQKINKIKYELDVIKSLTEESDYFKNIEKNFSSPIFKNQEELVWQQFVLSPILMARIESTLVKLILSGKLDLNAQLWEIAILERDVPAAGIALEHFNLLINRLFKLEDKARTLPKIKLYIFNTPEYKKAELNKNYQVYIKSFESFPKDKIFDVVIDAAILERMLPVSKTFKTKAKNTVLIRSAHKIKSIASFKKTKDILSRSLFDISMAKHSKYLDVLDNYEFFLKDFLRITHFKKEELKAFDAGLNGKKITHFILNKERKWIITVLLSLLKNGNIGIFASDANDAINVKHDLIQVFPYANITHTFEQVDKLLNKNKLLKKYKPSIIIFDSGFVAKNLFLKGMDHINVFSNYSFIINQSQRLSEWSYNYLPDFDLGINNLIKITDSNNIIYAISHSAKYTVLQNISSILGLSFGNTILEKNEFREFNYFVNPVKINKAHESISENKKLINVRQQINTALEIEEFVEQKEKIKSSEELLVITNPSNISKQNQQENFDDLYFKTKQKLPDYQINEFYAFNPKISSKFQKTNFLINNNNSEIVDATIHFVEENKIVELNYTDISKVVFNSVPIDLELIQNTIGALYNYQGQPEMVFNLLNKNDGLLEKEILLKKINQNFLGEKREINFFEELYRKIDFPHITNKEFLQNYILNKYHLETEFNFRSMSEKFLLQVYINDELCGKIDERNWEYTIENIEFVHIFQDLIVFFQNYFGEFDYFSTWIDRIHYFNEFKSLQEISTKLKQNEGIYFSLPIENQKLYDIVNLIIETFPDKINKQDIEKFINDNVDHVDFLKDLKQFLSIDKLPENIELKTESYFYHIRTSYLTKLFLNKLKRISWVESVFEDITKGIFVCNFKKLRISEIQKRAIKYLSNFYSQSYLDKAFNTNVNTKILSNIWQTFIKIYYREVKEKSEETVLQVIRFLFFQQTEQEKKSYRNLRAANYLRAYPYRMQSNKDFNDNLLEITSNLTRKSFQAVKDYISQMNYRKSQWFDLLNSAEELLKKKPDYWILNFLYGLASIIVNEEETIGFGIGVDKIAKAFTQMRLEEKQSKRQLEEKELFIFSKIAEQKTDLRDKVEPVVQLSMHRQWLSQFNQKFLTGYEG